MPELDRPEAGTSRRRSRLLLAATWAMPVGDFRAWLDAPRPVPSVPVPL